MPSQVKTGGSSLRESKYKAMRSLPGATRFRSRSPFGMLGRTTLQEPIFIVGPAVGSYCRLHLSDRTTGLASLSVSPRWWVSDRFVSLEENCMAPLARSRSQIDVRLSNSSISRSCAPALIHRICQTSNSLVPSMKLSSEVLEESFTLSISAISYGINLWKLPFIVPIQLNCQGADVFNCLLQREGGPSWNVACVRSASLKNSFL